MGQEADVIVIGMGPGGEDVAGKLASAGLDVVAIEGNLVGGECPYWGCIPSKMMLRAAHALAEARRVNQVAGKTSVEPDWSVVAKRVSEEATDGWNDAVAAKRFTDKGGRLMRGYAQLTSDDTVSVGDQTVRARKGIVIASGSAPLVPPIEGLEGTPYWTNHEALENDELPSSITVLGGGPVGVELAQVYSRFGAKTHVVDGGRHLLGREEPESGALLDKVFETEGIDVTTGTHAERVQYSNSQFEITLSNGKTLTSEALLVAVGRKVDLRALNVGAIGLDDSAKAIPVDDNMRVKHGIWALGDVTGKGAFTHVSMYQAGIVADELLGKAHALADYKALPRVTFTDPEIGAAGLTESAAREHCADITIGYTDLAASSRGFTHGPGNDGFIKLVVDRSRDVLVGATAAGPNGGEVLGLLALAIHEQTPVHRLREMIYAYPTFHRSIESALTDL